MSDSGPAFPTTAGQVVYSHGMTLRDWFAGQALTSLLRNPNHNVGTVTFERVGQDAYKLADAMIAARDEKGTW